MEMDITLLFFFGLEVCVLLPYVQSEIPGEECVGWSRTGGPIFCYECTADSNMRDNHCDDPFNTTDPRVNMTVCDGYCIKWFRSPRDGVMSHRRTCSDKLKIRLIINEVCVEESRPRFGHMCFCSENKCNAGNSNFLHAMCLLLMWSVAVFIFINR